MSRKEIDLAINWAALEGWNPGLYDGDCFFAADPEGFLVGELNQEPIASISVVKYGESFGFLGFYLVKPEYRGKGYGIQIWNAGLMRLQGRNIGLDGVVAQQENYKKSGFNLAYRNIRYEGVTGGPSAEPPGMVSLPELPFIVVERYDRFFFPENRSRFLQAWINQPESFALGVMEKGLLVGYGMIRTCRLGYKIGPLFADSPESAESLFHALRSRVKPESLFYLDVPEVNPQAVALAEKVHMTPIFETARMYTGVSPDLPFNRIFGVTSFELG